MTAGEVMTSALLRTARENSDKRAFRIQAMRAIGGNLSKLRQAMARQREYDRSTVNQIVRLARTVMDSGLFGQMSGGEVKRLIGMVKRAAGREDITKQAGEVVDLLLRHQLNECETLLQK